MTFRFKQTLLYRVYDSNGYGLDYPVEGYQSDEYNQQQGNSQFQTTSRTIDSAASNNSEATAIVSLTGPGGRCESTASNFASVAPSEAESYLAQLAATGRRYDSKPEDVVEFTSPVLSGSIGSEGAIIETNDAYEDYDR